MKASGIVRRIDDLGRIVIPREIQRMCGIKENDPFEIFYDEKEQTVTFKRYKYETDTERRAKWVNKWHRNFSYFDTASKHVGNMTIVVWGKKIATATCRSGDTYDRKTGEAICMAKLCGERIPEYI